MPAAQVLKMLKHEKPQFSATVLRIQLLRSTFLEEYVELLDEMAIETSDNACNTHPMPTSVKEGASDFKDQVGFERAFQSHPQLSVYEAWGESKEPNCAAGLEAARELACQYRVQVMTDADGTSDGSGDDLLLDVWIANAMTVHILTVLKNSCAPARRSRWHL